MLLSILAYYVVPRRYQGTVILAASAFYLASWDLRFLAIHVLVSLTAFSTAQMVHRHDSSRIWFFAGCGMLLTPLVLFKFLGFWRINIPLVSGSELSPGGPSNLLIPLGLSFYTLSVLAYLIDVRRRQIVPTKSFRDFFLFTSFFPHIVMGPIDRIQHLLPQLLAVRAFKAETIYEGIFWISLGLFKRLMLVNVLAPIYQRSISGAVATEEFGLQFLAQVLVGYVYFYSDFSSYMNLVTGCARFFGVDLAINFNQPYLARNPVASWQRWHMSLTSWIRDYIYLPLLLKTRNPMFCVFVLFLCLGMFHEVSFSYLVWTLYWTIITWLYMLYVRVVKRRFSFLNGDHPITVFLQVTITLFIVSFVSFFSWVRDISSLGSLLDRMLQIQLGYAHLFTLPSNKLVLLIIAVLIVIAQESRYKPENLKQRRFEIIPVALLNLFLLAMLGSFDDFAFQYINF